MGLLFKYVKRVRSLESSKSCFLPLCDPTVLQLRFLGTQTTAAHSVVPEQFCAEGWGGGSSSHLLTLDIPWIPRVDTAGLAI